MMKSLFPNENNDKQEGDAKVVKSQSKYNSFVDTITEARSYKLNANGELNNSDMEQLNEKINLTPTIMTDISSINNSITTESQVEITAPSNKSLEIVLDCIYDLKDLYNVILAATTPYLVSHNKSDKMDSYVAALNIFANGELTRLNKDIKYEE